jgi:hypothetical protein
MDNNTITIAELATIELTVGGKKVKCNPVNVKFSDMLDWSADIQAGMIMKQNTATDELEIIITKEYALKSKKVKVELACKLFGVSYDDEAITLEEWEAMLDVVDNSGFMKRLDRLNKIK